MNKIVVSLLLSLMLGGILLVGISLTRRAGESCRSCERLGQEISRLQEYLRSVREDTRALIQEVRSHEATSKLVIDNARAELAPAATDQAAAAKLAPANRPEDIKTYVLSALQEDRIQAEAKRQAEREEARQLSEAKRLELATMMAGPFDRFNLKVNSLAKVLDLDQAQKKSYYEVAKQARDKLKEARNLLMQAGSAQNVAEGNRSRGQENWGKLRELQETLQKEFEQGVQGILTASQLETYNQLSRSARDFQNLGQVAAPGQDLREFARPGGNGFPGGWRDRRPGGPGFGPR